jgi:hypothetical protein
VEGKAGATASGGRELGLQLHTRRNERLSLKQARAGFRIAGATIEANVLGLGLIFTFDILKPGSAGLLCGAPRPLTLDLIHR